VTDAPPAPSPGPRRARAGAGPDRAWAVAGGLVALALVPLAFLGPGTDLDVGAVLRSGRGIVEGTYAPSRNPGAPVHEAAVGALQWLAGTVGPNLGSLVAAAALTVVLALLLRREGVGRAGLAVAVVVANPWFLVAATSTVDFLWALALWAGAALVLRARAGLGGAAGAGVLGGLAVGCRASTAVLVAGLALAEALDRSPRPGARADGGRPDDPGPAAASGRDRAGGDGLSAGSSAPSGGGPSAGPGPQVRALVLAAVTAVVGLVLFLPAFLSSDGSLAFAQNDVPTSSVAVQVGRFLAKDLYFVGPFAAVVLVGALPALARTAARWRADWLVRLGLLTLLASQLLFLRFPWKMGHLLPTLVGLALVAARALGPRPRLLAALVGAQLLYAVVSVQLLTPNTPNAATGARLTFEPRWGALVVDVQCRLDDPEAWEGPGIARLHAVWDCAKPWAG